MTQNIHAGGYVIFSNFNYSHPEARNDEVFVFNETKKNSLLSFKKLRFYTKRLGKIAYDDFGRIIANARPIFVNKTELKNK